MQKVPSLLVVDVGPEPDDEMTGEEGVLREAGANETDEAAKSVSARGGGAS